MYALVTTMILRASLLFFIHIALCLAAPTLKEDIKAKIITYKNTNDGSGNYHFKYVTSNSITREETGTLVNNGRPGAYVEVEGSVSYLNPNGELTIVRYSADDTGYHILPKEGFLSLEFRSVWPDEPVLLHDVSPLIVASLLGGNG